MKLSMWPLTWVLTRVNQTKLYVVLPLLPNGSGKDVRVCVFAQGDAAEAAKAAGAELVGMDELAEEIKGGMMDFDVVIAAPDAMRVVGLLGKVWALVV